MERTERGGKPLYRETKHVGFNQGYGSEEVKGHGSVVDRRRDERVHSSFNSAHRPSTYLDEKEWREDSGPMKMSHGQSSGRVRGFHGKSGRKMFDRLMRSKVVEDKGWLAAAMILGLLVSYPLVIKPLHQVSTDMLSKMRGNLKTGAI
jgi:hypothetical protein